MWFRGKQDEGSMQDEGVRSYQAPKEEINDRNCDVQEPNSRLNSRPKNGGFEVKAAVPGADSSCGIRSQIAYYLSSVYPC